MRAIRARFLTAASTPVEERRLLRLARTLMVLRHDVLPALEQGSLRTRPHEAMLAVEAILARAIDEKVVVLAVGGDRHTYSEHDLWSGVRTQLSDLGLDDRLGRDKLLFLSLAFPLAEKDNVLLHANLCHEIGHQLGRSYRWADPLLAVLPGDEAVEALGAEVQPATRYRVLSATEQRTVLDGLVARTGRNYWDSGVLANWIGELVADAVALALLGPAAALAIADLLTLALGQERDAFTPTHPRWALRIRLHQVHLAHEDEGLSFDQLLTSYPKVLESLEHTHQEFLGREGQIEVEDFESHEGYRLERTPAFYAACEKALANKLPDIAAAVRNSLKARAVLFTPAQFAADVPPLIEKLEALLPPSSIGSFGSERPASYAGIMNAGAIVRRDRLAAITQDVGRFKAREEEGRGAGRYDAEELIFSLVRKAISDADIHRRWQSSAARP